MQRVQRQLLNLAAAEAKDRQHAAEALGEIGSAAAEAVPVLVSTLHNAEEEDVRRAAAEALGQIGPTAAEAVPALRAARSDAKASVRQAARAALKQIEPASA